MTWLDLTYYSVFVPRLFKSTLFTCNVCFESQLGATCLQFLPCHHVFCNNCMKEYFLVQIKDGSVQCLTCPEDKCTSMALPFQVKTSI
jgi:E3 ubiquitin-protein ligase RNF14